MSQLSLDLKELDSPEELHPLKEALERANQRVDQSTGIREALEAEVCKNAICSGSFQIAMHQTSTYALLRCSLQQMCVSAQCCVYLQAQNLAELAIDAREKAEKARQKVAEAARDVDAAKIVKQKLDADIEQLRQVSNEPSAGEEQAFRADQTVDLGTSEHGTPNAEQSLDAELKGKLQQLDSVSKTIDETETKVRHRKSHNFESCLLLCVGSTAWLLLSAINPSHTCYNKQPPPLTFAAVSNQPFSHLLQKQPTLFSLVLQHHMILNHIILRETHESIIRNISSSFAAAYIMYHLHYSR